VVAAPPAVAPPPAGPDSITSLVGSNFAFKGKRFTLNFLVLRAVPKGATAQIFCRGKGCPFRASKQATKVSKGEIDIARVLSMRQRKLRAGQTLEVGVTAPNLNGRVVSFPLTAGKTPVSAAQCRPLGSTKPKRTC
jgi:hypothetical protein